MRTEEASSLRLQKMEPSEHIETFEGALSYPSSNALDKFQFVDHGNSYKPSPLDKQNILTAADYEKKDRFSRDLICEEPPQYKQ